MRRREIQDVHVKRFLVKMRSELSLFKPHAVLQRSNRQIISMYLPFQTWRAKHPDHVCLQYDCAASFDAVINGGTRPGNILHIDKDMPGERRIMQYRPVHPRVG